MIRGVNEEDRFALSSTAEDEDGDTVFGAIHAARKLDDEIKPVMRKGLSSETVDLGRLEQFASRDDGNSHARSSDAVQTVHDQVVGSITWRFLCSFVSSLKGT
jgi:hypothetical protein